MLQQANSKRLDKEFQEGDWLDVFTARSVCCVALVPLLMNSSCHLLHVSIRFFTFPCSSFVLGRREIKSVHWSTFPSACPALPFPSVFWTAIWPPVVGSTRARFWCIGLAKTQPRQRGSPLTSSSSSMLIRALWMRLFRKDGIMLGH
ncbi:hypothetical protein Salat_1111000 [Sesamum alatum]|uniref:Uncharacterized protein n=1 Tax=Sesamum alatum TaxID=300844 RepID=A0AAE2CT35_9LAMI|nr:hypothetical protein Salat_1111000 [Sesamum alatum]